RIPIIMLTAKGDNIDRVVGLEMGADDYVPKPCYPRELVARLRAVLRRTGGDPAEAAHGTDDLLSDGALNLSPRQREVRWNGQAIDLTVSEFNMLELLLRSGDKVVTKDELSERALGRPREAYDRSVDVHMSNLRQKLSQVAGESVQIGTVRGIGYRLARGVAAQGGAE
ncbi:MAG: response regulator transcription factor, partial [Dongiaceae bacterium]